VENLTYFHVRPLMNLRLSLCSSEFGGDVFGEIELWIHHLSIGTAGVHRKDEYVLGRHVRVEILPPAVI
jgi:hypothetical protein